MDESKYLRLVADTFKRIEDALDDVDPSDVDTTSAANRISAPAASCRSK